jgi:hypothetical protein
LEQGGAEQGGADEETSDGGAEVLAELIATLAEQPEQERAGDVLYTKQFGFQSHDGEFALYESWRSLDGSGVAGTSFGTFSQATENLSDRAAESVEITGRYPAGSVAGRGSTGTHIGLTPNTAADLAALPSDAQALLEVIREQRPETETDDLWLAVAISELLAPGRTSPAVRSAALQILTESALFGPVTTTTDALGRPGLRVTGGGWGFFGITLDPSTGEVLATDSQWGIQVFVESRWQPDMPAPANDSAWNLHGLVIGCIDYGKGEPRTFRTEYIGAVELPPEQDGQCIALAEVLDLLGISADG